MRRSRERGEWHIGDLGFEKEDGEERGKGNGKRKRGKEGGEEEEGGRGKVRGKGGREGILSILVNVSVKKLLSIRGGARWNSYSYH